MDNDYYHGKPLRIGNETQLFIDDSIIENRWNLERVLISPQKYIRNPVLLPDKPWEGDTVSVPNVLFDKDSGLYRMWYTTNSYSAYYGAGGPSSYVCYAESEDGIHWEKPLLDACDFPGFSKTNVVYCGAERAGTSSCHVFINAGETDAGKRYNMVTLEKRTIKGEIVSGVSLAVSPDGLKWKPFSEIHILDFHSDTKNHIAYDPVSRTWRLYGRPMYWFTMSGVRNRVRMPDGSMNTRHTRRHVICSTSPDLKQWSYPRSVMYPDERDTSDYDDCTVFRYGGQFLMFYSAMDNTNEYRNDIRIASSPDGFHWTRYYTREPYMNRGGEGAWDERTLYFAGEPVAREEKLFIYYGGLAQSKLTSPMMGGIGLAMTKVDRFVEQSAGDQPGYLNTKEIIVEGNRLKINTTIHSQDYRNLQIRAELIKHPVPGGHTGFTPVYEGFSLDDCDPIRWTDRPNVSVSWKGNPDIGSLMGKPVHIRFEIQNMGLFSFRIDKE